MRAFLSASFVPVLFLSIAGCGTDKAPGADDPSGGTSNAGGSGGSDASGGDGSGGTSSGGKGGGGKGGSSSGGSGGTGGEDPYAHCATPWSEPPPASDCDLNALTDSGMTIGDLSGVVRSVNADTTLTTGQTYNLSGLTVIRPGVTLTIEPCVKIVGQDQNSKLVTHSGINDLGGGNYEGVAPGRLVAVGEENAPIVFTSKEAAGSRAPGQWGGIVLNGKAPENVWRNVGEPPISEGILEESVAFGWQTDEYAAEDSGKLEYVRVEFVGHDLGDNNETNGITFNGVGSGTSIHHVMVSNSIDDCFEWFGGTVNAHHLVAFNCDDDEFDADLGFSGKVQFAFGRQFVTSSETDSNGFEFDSNRNTLTAEPFTTASWSNVTLCGANSGLALVNPRIGAIIRRYAKTPITDMIMTGFDSYAFSIRDIDGTLPTVTHSTIFENGDYYDAPHFGEADPTLGATWFMDQEGNSTDKPEGYCDCWANPPAPFPKTAIEGTPAGAGFFDPEASYQGAFEDATVEGNWMRGSWVDWAEE